MPYTPFVVDGFGGLDLYNDPQEVGASSAVDLLNVDIDQRGRVRTRDGGTALSTTASTNALGLGMSYYKDGSGVEWIVAVEPGSPGVYRPYNLSTGAAGTTQSDTFQFGSTSNNSFARFGDPSNTRLYAAASGVLRRFDGSVWAAVAAPPIAPNLLAVTANDNRLAIATGSSSRVHFSDAGAPETFGANNFVDLWPGDGESIKALVRWRDLLFAFKQSKFAVFTGTSVDSDGGPVFNYRSVDAGRGVFGVGMAAAGEQGVYFADVNSFYVTAGDTPRYLSRPIEPWLRAGTYGNLPFYSAAFGALTFVNRRLYATYPSGTSSVTVVYDPLTDAWLAWQGGFLVTAGVPASSASQALYYADSTSKKVARLDNTTDLGAAISWRYQSGYYDLGAPGQVKITQESRVWGTGSATLKVANDFGSLDTGSALTLGTSPTVADAWQQIDREGTLFQHQLSGSGPASVSRLAHYISFTKPPGVG